VNNIAIRAVCHAKPPSLCFKLRISFYGHKKPSKACSAILVRTAAALGTGDL